MYKQLACYYKYSNSQKYREFYLKHIESMQKLVNVYHQTRSVQQPQPPQVYPAKVRLLHVAPNVEALDIYLNNQRVLQNISFKQYSDYISVPQGQYRVDIYPTGIMESPIFSSIIPIMSRMAYTIAVGGDSSRLQVMSFMDSTYLPYGKAKVRFTHVSPDAPTVDLVIQGNDVMFPSVSFKQATEYITVSPGILELEIRETGTNNSLLPLSSTKLDSNKVYTIYAVGFASKEPKLEPLFLTN
ncbi:DUF4397 domain-containing protein [Bacillus sp. 165]|nr:DUF4397 domain-containing protein [Bacillus sp. 165]MBO9129311.1 DUF4397 domain-containing protein [Bacillus sp. 165]